MKKINNKKKLLLVTTMLLTGFSIALYNKSNNTKIMSYEEVKDNRAMAFYIEKDGSYEPTSIMPTRGYKLNEEKSICSNGAKVSLNTSDYSLNISNLNGHTNCYLYFDEIFGSAAKKVLGDITNVEEKTEFTGIATAEDTGIYSAPDDYGTSYYFRGLEENLNNWVKFADSYWRIIRVNGNGTVRMIYSGAANGAVSNSNKTGETTQIGTSMYNHTYNDNAYVGYMMGIPLNGTEQTRNETSTNSTSYEQAHTNTYDSDAKKIIDSWYKINIEDKNFSKYVDINTGFCNDRTVNKGDKIWWNKDTKKGFGTNLTAFNGWSRTVKATGGDNYLSKQMPTLQCENKARDLFTLSGADEGNKALKYPVGLVTMDELMFAGGFGRKNNINYYLYNNEFYWTMTPGVMKEEGYYAYMFVVNNAGLLFYNYGSISSSYGLRPVINLRADTKFTYNNESTKGSETDPFIVV